MRGEREMYQMILDIAKETEQVLAVYMNGSRTNENVPGDIFQDYDIVF
ncbi:MAG: aminoglycoside 6-adenylyltransferase, partial [Lachnospiraceae bacterium]|nr:aminoglycoside 6-adenylyltransferase [Lachnospiraceae bacterium]